MKEEKYRGSCHVIKDCFLAGHITLLYICFPKTIFTKSFLLANYDSYWLKQSKDRHATNEHLATKKTTKTTNPIIWHKNNQTILFTWWATLHDNEKGGREKSCKMFKEQPLENTNVSFSASTIPSMGKDPSKTSKDSSPSSRPLCSNQ